MVSATLGGLQIREFHEDHSLNPAIGGQISKCIEISHLWRTFAQSREHGHRFVRCLRGSEPTRQINSKLCCFARPQTLAPDTFCRSLAGKTGGRLRLRDLRRLTHSRTDQTIHHALLSATDNSPFPSWLSFWGGFHAAPFFGKQFIGVCWASQPRGECPLWVESSHSDHLVQRSATSGEIRMAPSGTARRAHSRCSCPSAALVIATSLSGVPDSPRVSQLVHQELNR